MMRITLLKNCIMNNLTIKVVSIIVGYCLWSFLSDSYIVNQWKTIPICFYNISDNNHIQLSQDSMKIKLSGKRSDLALCNNLAFHIDAHSLSKGQQFLTPNETSLFLPNNVKLLYSHPLKVSVNA